MNLYILRHAIAVPRGTRGFKDENRPLTKDGARKMKTAAKGMRALDITFDRIATSPYLRARQTAEIVAEVFDHEVEIWDSLIPHKDTLELVATLRKFNDKSILLVGHEPHLSGFVSLLISGDRDAQIELKKGALCKLTSDDLIHGQCADLQWLLAPAQLRNAR